MLALPRHSGGILPCLRLTLKKWHARGQVTVLELSNLKKIGKRSTLLLLDKNGGTSKAVAKELARLGFRKAYVISGGFSGERGRQRL